MTKQKYIGYIMLFILLFLHDLNSHESALRAKVKLEKHNGIIEQPVCVAFSQSLND